MKRLILSLAAIAAVAGPIAAAGVARADPPPWAGGGRNHERDGDGEHDRGRDWGRHDEGRDHDRREDFRERHDWDDRRHNGYYYNNRWLYGPPPSAYYSDPYYRPGFSAWRRGVVLPPHYRGYVVGDYYRYHLRPPPRGYAWYRVGDEYLLAAVATGLIFEIINN
jgi:Ni/Co efflux regulator RcnB